MKVIIKNKKNEYNVEIESTQITVEEFKRLFKIKYELDLDDLKILYKGKILKNECKLEEYKIKDQSKLVTSGDFKKSINKKISQELPPGMNSNKSINSITEKEIDKNWTEINNSPNNTLSNNNTINENNQTKIESEEKNNQIIDQSNLPKELKNIAIYIKILTSKDENKMNEILNNIEVNNPALLNEIMKNKEEFIKYLKYSITNEDFEIYKNNISSAKELLNKGFEEKKDKVKISLTRKETEDINKLKKFGFETDEIIYAYLTNYKKYDKTEKYLINQKNNKKDEEEKNKNS